ncbi:hypothetical protein HELRODRAFT_162795 [Helobdella robusta]|uniref:Uncharacterized protein n=1 Tax=Helobdella robusta TaxID=6412 RepID=T1ET60_HELRO|nr:hypothetical protein HELRODRAFT_162795 [Helobdella robusta]ESN99277.1 hypothetical protein HELRODRAFT_162795 [Helobdella robusta]
MRKDLACSWRDIRSQKEKLAFNLPDFSRKCDIGKHFSELITAVKHVLMTVKTLTEQIVKDIAPAVFNVLGSHKYLQNDIQRNLQQLTDRISDFVKKSNDKNTRAQFKIDGRMENIENKSNVSGVLNM